MVVAGLTVALRLNPATLGIAGWTLILIIIWFIIRRSLAPLAFSSLTLVFFGLLVMGSIGAAISGRLANIPGGAGIKVALTTSQTVATAQLFLLCATGLIVGATLLLPLASSGHAPKWTARGPVRWSSSLVCLLSVVGLLPMVTLVGGSGLEALWRRDLYIDAAVQDLGWRAPMVQLTIAASAFTGYVLAKASGVGRIFPVLSLVAYLSYFLGTGSRRLAAFPLLVALGYYLAVRHRRAAITLFASCGATILLLPLPLYFRSLSEHGIQPYLTNMSQAWSQESSILAGLKSVFIAFPLTGATAWQAGGMPTGSLGISLNPLPGGWVGWYELAPKMRLNIYTPFTAIGELGAHGWPVAFVYWLSAGALLMLIDQQIKFIIRSRVILLALIPVGLCALFFLYGIQYNLRSATRLIFLAETASLAIALVPTAMSVPSRNGWRDRRRRSARERSSR